MSAQHTSKPWEVWPDYDEEGDTGKYCIGHRECPVACTCGEGTEADAMRIVACVNALSNIDWPLLRQQKLALVSASLPAHSADSDDALDGIIHLIDHIQDSMVESGVMTETEVFGKQEEA